MYHLWQRRPTNYLLPFHKSSESWNIFLNRATSLEISQRHLSAQSSKREDRATKKNYLLFLQLLDFFFYAEPDENFTLVLRPREKKTRFSLWGTKYICATDDDKGGFTNLNTVDKITKKVS